jgi:phage replication-related protein YjqB (UPF0714/DUF867 family)
MNVGDRYRSLQDLMETEVEGTAYRVVQTDRGHSVTVVAPHGGGIEPHTSAVAARLAHEDFNLFLFEGILPRGNRRLHVSSERFSHPTLEAMLRRSRVAISIHGKQGTDADDEHVGVGGLNEQLASLLVQNLQAASFNGLAEPNYALAGRYPQNFVNLPRERGVQLELTLLFRLRLHRTPALLTSFTETIRSAVLAYISPQ